MPDTTNYYTRPALTFIVEGTGEYSTFKKLAHRRCPDLHYCEVQNARGIGNIHANFEQRINDAILASHPVTIICCLDFTDIVPSIYPKCEDIVRDLTNRYILWSTTHGSAPRYQPLPHQFTVVVQRQKLETWLLAGHEKLTEHIGLGTLDVSEDDMLNVDNLVSPVKLLKEIDQNRLFDSKDPHDLVRAFDILDFDTISSRSRSFRKLDKEIYAAAQLWKSLAGCH